MSNSRVECPYCGEFVAVGARKCRFCGEWLDDDTSSQSQQQQANYPVAQPYEPMEVATSDDNYTPMSKIPNGNRVPMQQQQAPVFNGQTSTAPQQNFVVQPQVTVAPKMEQNVTVETTQVVVNNGSSESSGLMWAQVLAVGVGVGFATSSFWYGVAAAIILGICCFIPYIGAGLCVVLGLASGALAGLISAALGAPAWIAWMIGILGAAVLVYSNLRECEHISD